MAETGSPVGKYTTKWQLALVLGLPVAVGVGYWYLANKGKKGKYKKAAGDSEGLQEIPINGKTTKTSDSTTPKTPLQSATALKEEGNTLFKNAKYNEAIAAYEKAIEVCPESESISLATFYQNKAAAYEQLKQYEDSKDACTIALSYNAKYTKALLRRAKAYEQMKDLSSAFEDVIAACILENFHSQSTLLSADRILKELGLQHAKEAMAKRVPVMPSPTFIKTYFGSFTKDPLNEFLTETPEDSSKGFLKAVELFKKEEYDSIIDACTEEINMTEVEALYKNEALVLRSTFYALTGENNKALLDLDIVIHNYEANAKLRSNALIKRASIHLQLENVQTCLSDFDAAIVIDEHNSDIYHHRGVVNLLIGKLNEAADDLKIAVALNPTNPINIVQKCFTDYRLALSSEDMVSVKDILSKFEEIVEQYPDCTECYTLYAQVLTEHLEYEKADKYFKKAIQLEPENALLLVRRAMLVLKSTGDVETAIKYINEALVIDDKCECAYETLGTIEVQRGNLKKAVDMFDKAIPLAKTELEMCHLFSLKDAAVAQKKVAERMNMHVPSDLFHQ